MMETQRQENTVKGDKLDELKFSEICQQISPEIDKYTEKLKTVKRLSEDVWRALYKYQPELVPPEVIKDSHQFNRTLMEKCMGLKEYDVLRTYTQLDDLSSTVATCTLLEQLIRSIPQEELEKISQGINACENLQNQLQRLQDMMDGTSTLSQSNPNDQQLKQQLQNIRQNIQSVTQQLQQASQKLHGDVEKSGMTLRSAVRQSLKNAIQETKDIHDFMMGWGIEPGTIQKMPYEEKIKLAQYLRKSEILQKVARIIGRMKLLLESKQKQKITKIPEEVVDIVQGDDIMRTVPSDLMLMMDEDTEPLFMRKFTEKQLLNYELEGKEKQGEGPIVVCIDNSGSMMGEPEVWSKAIAYALLDFASKKKRMFAVIHFGSRDEYKIFEIPPHLKGEGRISIIMEMLTYFEGGGTDFETPLEQALKIIEKDEFKKADIVFITDDQCDISDEFLQKYKKIKKEKDFKCIGIAIGIGYGTMKKFCDVVIPCEKICIDDTNIAGELFENI